MFFWWGIMTRDRERCCRRCGSAFYLHDAGFLGVCFLHVCFLIVARLAEFNSLLPCSAFLGAVVSGFPALM
jgi:hypothetical protein